MNITKPKLIKPKLFGDLNVWGEKLNDTIDMQDIFNGDVTEVLETHEFELKRLDKEKLSIDSVHSVVKPVMDNYIETGIKPAVDEYLATEKKPELDNYTNTKKQEIHGYVQATSKPSLDEYTEVKKTELNTHTEAKKSVLDTHTSTKQTQLDTHTRTKEGQLDSHERLKEEELDSFTLSKKTELTSHTESKKSEVDIHTQDSIGKIDVYTVTKKEQLDNYTLEKENKITVHTNSEIERLMDVGVDGLNKRMGIIEGDISVIKPVVDNLEGSISTKFDDARISEDNKLILSAESIDIISLDLPAGGSGGGGGGGTTLQRNLRILNNLPSKTVVTTKNQPCILDFTFISQERYSSDEKYEDTKERGLCQILIKNSKSTEYTIVKETIIQSSVSTKLDISELIIDGSNQVMLKVVGEVTEAQAPNFVYSVQVTNLSTSIRNFVWWKPYTSGLSLPVFISGSYYKQLIINVIGNNYTKQYVENIGSSTYLDVPYNVRIEKPNDDGVYTIEVFCATLDGSLITTPETVNTMFVTEGSGDFYLVTNNVAQKSTNWNENKLCEYSVYDANKTTTSLEIISRVQNDIIFEITHSNLSTGTKQNLTVPIGLNTETNEDFEMLTAIKHGSELITEIPTTVDNSLGFGAEAGATFFLKPANRSNSQSNREKIINEVDKSMISAIWNNMNWGSDGWVEDSNGIKNLTLFSGSSCEINYSPFGEECAMIGKTIELDILTKNVSDFKESVLEMCATNEDSFVGLKVTPENIWMNSKSSNDFDTNSVFMLDEKRTRVTVVITPNIYGNIDFNLCAVYIDGVKNREFCYKSNDYFANNGKLKIGSNGADTHVYAIRVYDKALGSEAVLKNYINLLTDTDERLDILSKNNINDEEGIVVDFEKTLEKYNVIVFDAQIPYKGNTTTTKGTLEVYYKNNPELNVSISNVTAKGQGTTSMKYWIWNTRYQLDKVNSLVSYVNNTEKTEVGKWTFADSSIAGTKFTAKKNYASSMQSHKIGAVNSYTDIYRELGLSNEAMRTEKYKSARVSVQQLPFMCFQKDIIEGKPVYTFKGLFTMGQDKGDSDTFGFDTEMFPNLIAVEGSDNAPLFTQFRVPWSNKYIKYNEVEEAWQYNGVNSWDFGGGKTSNIGLFKEAYEKVYECSPRLEYFKGTVEDLHSQTDTYKFSVNELWVTDGEERFNLYYYEPSEKKFIQSTVNETPVNLKEQLGVLDIDVLGKTEDELNNLFVSKRIDKFRKEAPQYWDIEDTLLFMNNVEFNAGTDERAKNTYPYSFGENGSKFKWRIDDTDTRFDITNRGLATKPYSVETHDYEETIINGNVVKTPIWNGETNNFFNLIELAFENEKITSMRNMMTAMQKLGGLKQGDDYDKLLAFYKKYFWDVAQNYFPIKAYNEDAKICYEEAKILYDKGIYQNDTDPIEQSLGDHFSAELRWVSKRIIYMMSKYSFGMFSADGGDSILVRASGNTIEYNLTPAIDLYPAVANGTSIIRGNRTKTGETCGIIVDLSGAGDQQNIIQGASYLRDIGEWHNKNVTGSMLVQGRRLTDIKLGSKTEPITINISSLTISNCESLQTLMLSNISTLTGVLDLRNCVNLKNVYMDGTNLSQVSLPEGGGLESIEYSSKNNYIFLKNQSKLSREGIDIELCKDKITDFFVQNCPSLDSLDFLTEILDTQKSQEVHSLKRVRVVGINAVADITILDKLSTLCDGSYSGLTEEGFDNNGLPVLSGYIKIEGVAYNDVLEEMMSKFPDLQIEASLHGIRFKDPEVFREVLIGNDVNNDGFLTLEEVRNATNYGVYTGNTLVREFEELELFERITSISNSSFAGSTIEKIKLPPMTTSIRANAFSNCESVHIQELPDKVMTIGEFAFNNCLNLGLNKIPSTVSIIEEGVFNNARININDISMLTEVKQNGFKNSTLKLNEIPNIKIHAGAFDGCSGVEISKVPNSLRIVQPNTFRGCTSETLTIHQNVDEIHSLAFGNLNGLRKITILGTPTFISEDAFSTSSPIEIRVSWKEGEVSNAPWGAVNSTILYDSHPSEYYFADNTVSEYVGNKITEQLIHKKDFELVEFFGCEGMPDENTVSYFSKKTVESWSGIELLTGLKAILIKDYIGTASEIEITSKNLRTLVNSFRNTPLAHIKLPEEIGLVSDMQGAFLDCVNLSILEIPAILPFVATPLELTGLDADGRVIYYLENNDIKNANQIKYHDLNGVPEYSLSELDYSRLGLPKPINVIFTDPNIAEYVSISLGVGVTDSVSEGELSEIEWFGFSGIPNESSISWFNGKSITTFSGVEFLTGLKAVHLKGALANDISSFDSVFSDNSNLIFATLPSEMSYLVDLDETFYNCDNLTFVELPNTIPNVTSLSNTFYGCTSLTSITLPAKLPSVITSLSDTYMNTTTIPKRVIKYHADDSITTKSQIKYHNSTTGVSEYTNCDVDYSNLVNLPLSISEVFECPNVQEHIRVRLNKPSINALVSKADLNALSTFGVTSNGIPTSYPTSVFNGLEITSTKGLELLTNIKYFCIQGCTNTEFIIPEIWDNSLTSMYYTFSDCRSLTSISLPDTLVNVTDLSGTFSDCTGLTSITIPDTLVNVTDLSYTFYGCTNLTSVTLPNTMVNVTGLSSTFRNCTGLTSITIPDTLVNVTDLSYAFRDCTNLTSVTLPNTMANVTNLSDTFYGCTGLTGEIVIPPTPKLTTFKSAFSGTNFASIEFTNLDSMTTLSWMLVPSASPSSKPASLKRFVLPENMLKLTSMSYLFNYTDIYYNSNAITTLEEVVLPSNIPNVTDLSYAFRNCPNLTSISLPDTLVNVTDLSYTFSNCTGLTSITIPDTLVNVTNLSYTFYGCTNLTSATLPNTMVNVTDLSSTFRNCPNLTSISLPDTLVNVTDLSYTFYGCRSLTSISLPDTIVNVTNLSYTFYGCTNLTGEIVIPPTPKLTTFTSAFSGTNFASIEFTNLDSMTTLSNMLVPSASPSSKPASLKRFVLPENMLKLTSMSYLFNYTDIYYNSNAITTLEEVVLPSNIPNVTDLSYAFYGCTGLTSVTLPNTMVNVTDLSCTFSGCSGLTSATLPNTMVNVTDLSSTFSGCSGLTSVTLPNTMVNVTDLSYTFSGCSGLTSVTIPAKLPLVITSLSDTYMNTTTIPKRVIKYHADDSITTKSQIKYHNSTTGVSEYTNCDVDYSNLVNLPSSYKMYLAFEGEEYPKELTTTDFDSVILNELELHTITIDKLKKGDFKMPSEGKYRFSMFKEGKLIGSELICLYSTQMSENLEEISIEDIQEVAKVLL